MKAETTAVTLMSFIIPNLSRLTSVLFVSTAGPSKAFSYEFVYFDVSTVHDVALISPWSLFDSENLSSSVTSNPGSSRTTRKSDYSQQQPLTLRPSHNGPAHSALFGSISLQ